MIGAPRLRWSWAGLVAAALPFGLLSATGVLWAYQFRTGMDGDLLALKSPRFLDFAFLAIPFGAIGIPLLGAGWWIGRLAGGAPRQFLVAGPSVALLALAGWKAFIYLSWGGPDLAEITWTYLPPYLEFLVVGVAMCVAARTYIAVAQEKAVPQ